MWRSAVCEHIPGMDICNCFHFLATGRCPRLLCRLEAPGGDVGEPTRTREDEAEISPDAPPEMTILGKVLEILEKRGELENCGWIFVGQANKETEWTLRLRMEATTRGYWEQEAYIRQDSTLSWGSTP